MLKTYKKDEIQKFISMYDDMHEYFQYVWQRWYNYVFDDQVAEIERRDFSEIRSIWIEGNYVKLRWRNFYNNDDDIDNVPLRCIYNKDIEDQFLIDLLKR